MASTLTVFKVVAFAIGVYFLKKYTSGGVCQSNARLDKKVAIITGANTGIGKENVIDFIQRGAKVYMACRSMERGEAAARDIKQRTNSDDDKLIVMKLDLASIASIKQFSEQFHKKEDKLDLLINNAGIMWSSYNKTEDGFEEQFGVNHLGHFLLTNLLLGHLKAASPSRVVTVSSKSHEFGKMYFDDLLPEKTEYNRNRAYSQSKIANILFSKELARRLEGSGVTTYSLHPGVIADTELMRHVKPWFLNLPIIKQIIKAFLWLLTKDSWHGAQTQICCAVSQELANESGKYYSDCVEKQPTADAQSLEDSTRLWKISEELVGINSSLSS